MTEVQTCDTIKIMECRHSDMNPIHAVLRRDDSHLKINTIRFTCIPAHYISILFLQASASIYNGVTLRRGLPGLWHCACLRLTPAVRKIASFQDADSGIMIPRQTTDDRSRSSLQH